MFSTSIHPDRIQDLNDDDVRDGSYVLYWMQASQRAEVNHALEYAIQAANELGRSVLAVFGLTDDYPDANLRHYTFMLQGLAATSETLARRKIKLVVRPGRPSEVVAELAEDAALVVTDRAYLRDPRAWRSEVADAVECRVVQVEGNVVVPVEVASNKREWAARTIRPKIHEHLDEFLQPLDSTAAGTSSLPLAVTGLDLDDLEGILVKLDIDRSVPAVTRFTGGTPQANGKLRRLVESVLTRYDDDRNQPHLDGVSYLSPYLHFGQISPVAVALAVREAGGDGADAYLEELVVRRELAVNYAFYEPDYDSYSALPDWAKKTLDEHRDDEREHQYTRGELEAAETHDPYWNAAMQEMVHTGFMHNYMRMYWGKKVIEWTNTPEYAFRTLLYLNNKYFLDGRDTNSFTNVGWIFGLHDRAWNEREVFGKVRYMSAGGLERKTDPDAYIELVDRLARDEGVELDLSGDDDE